MWKHIARFVLVQDSEHPQVKHFLLLTFLVGCGMAVGRATSDALFFKRYGIEYLPVMYVIVSVFLALVSLVYIAYSDRLKPERFFRILFVAIIGCLIVSWLVMRFSGMDNVYPAYFLVYELASELLLVHTSLYVGQNLLAMQAQRLMPLILAGSQLGIIVGGIFVAYASSIIGVQNMLLVWCLLLLLSAIVIVRWHRRHGPSAYYRAPPQRADQFQQAVGEIRSGLKLIRNSELLRAASLALFFMVMTFYVMCYSVNRIYTETFAAEETLSAFLGGLAAANSGAALLLQIFVTNRLIRKFGIKTVNLLFPITSIVSFSGLMFSLTLPFALVASFNKDAIMTAFRNPVRNLFFAALPDNVQGRARATSVAFVLPVALTAAGALLWLMQHMDNRRYIIALGLTTAAAYLFFNRRMNRAYVAEMVAHLRQHLVPDDQLRSALRRAPEELFDELSKGVHDADSQMSISFAKILVESFPERAASIILARAKEADLATRNQLLELLHESASTELEAQLWEWYDSADDHLRGSILAILFAHNSNRAAAMLPELLASANARVRATAIRGALAVGTDQQRRDAIAAWCDLVDADIPGAHLAALELVDSLEQVGDQQPALLGAYRRVITDSLNNEASRVQQKALAALAQWPDVPAEPLDDELSALLNSTDAATRAACVTCAPFVSNTKRGGFLERGLEDSSPKVRAAAAQALLLYMDHPLETAAVWLSEETHGSPRAQAALLEALPESSLTRDTMEAIAANKAATAYRLVKARSIVAANDADVTSAHQLLLHALRERAAQYIDLALLALRGLERPEEISVVRGALHSEDSRHTTRACEVLRNMRATNTAKLLSDVIESLNSEQETRTGMGAVPFFNLQGVLLWCEQTRDPWLRDCARYALAR